MRITYAIVILASVCTYAWASGANQAKVDSAKTHLETAMTTRGVAFILSMKNGEVETDSFGKLKCSDSAMLRDLSFYSSRRQPATVVFEKGSRRITSVSSAPTDKVVSISARTPVEEKVAVQLMMRPTVLFLRTSNARFEELYDMLKKAVAEKRRVHLGVLPGDDVIEDVRVEAAKQ